MTGSGMNSRCSSSVMCESRARLKSLRMGVPKNPSQPKGRLNKRWRRSLCVFAIRSRCRKFKPSGKQCEGSTLLQWLPKRDLRGARLVPCSTTSFKARQSQLFGASPCRWRSAYNLRRPREEIRGYISVVRSPKVRSRQNL